MLRLSRKLLAAAVILVSVSALALTGCDRKETILDVETPGGKLTIEKDKSDGGVEVDVDAD